MSFCFNFQVFKYKVPWLKICIVALKWVSFGWLTKVYVWKRSVPSNGFLHRFCLTKGSTLISQVHYTNPWFMYQNRLGPSGGIYYPNFVPCFVYHQLNGSFWFWRSKVTQFWFSKLFFYVKNRQNLSDFFSLKNIKKGAQHLLLAYFHNFDFKCALFSKSIPNFWLSKPKRTKSLEFLYTPSWSWDQAYSSLNSAKLSYSSEVTLVHT